MARLLYTLGKFSFRRCWTVVATWVALLVVSGLAALTFHGPTDDSFVIPGTEAQETIDLLQERFPDRSGGTVQVAFAAPQGEELTEEENQDAISATLARIEEISGVDSTVDPYEPLREAEEDYEEGVADAVAEAEDEAEAAVAAELANVPPALVSEEEREERVEEARQEARERAREEAPEFETGEVLEEIPYVSEDRDIAVAQVRFTQPDGEIDADTVERLLDTGEPAQRADLRVDFTGAPIEAAEVEQIDGSQTTGIAVSLLLLTVNFGALATAGIPIVIALIGVGLGMAGVYTVSGFMDLPSTAPILALMLGIALGIDYSLFILARYRQLRADGFDNQESAARAVGTAGTAVTFAGVTNAIALLGLAVAGIPFLTIMGLAAVVTVTAAVLVTLTLLPALFAITRGRVVALRLPVLGRRAERAVSDENTMGARWVRLVVKRPMIPIVVVLAVLGALIVPVRDLHLALPTAETSAPGSTQRAAYETITEGLGEGYNAPLAVVAEVGEASDPEETAGDVADRLGEFDRAREVFEPRLNDAEDLAVITVIPQDGPTDPGTEELLRDIRALSGEEFGERSVVLNVTGATAMSIDVSQRLGEAMPVFLVVVVGLALILLAMVFRSVVVPIKTALSFALSTVAALGATVLVFQWGIGAETLGLVTGDSLISFMPIILIAIMFGLAMDYEMFLVSRMRENYVRTGDARGSVVTGYRQAARVVTVAALIMISVFAFFVWGDSTMIQPIAFGLAVGILLDALLVRMTLVPAVMALFGRAAWWLPSWLDRVLPPVDAEGERLERNLEESPALAGQRGAE